MDTERLQREWKCWSVLDFKVFKQGASSKCNMEAESWLHGLLPCFLTRGFRYNINGIKTSNVWNKIGRSNIVFVLFYVE